MSLPIPPKDTTASSIPWPPVVKFSLDRFTRDLSDIVATLEARDYKPEHLKRKEIDELKILVWDCINEDALRRVKAAQITAEEVALWR